MTTTPCHLALRQVQARALIDKCFLNVTPEKRLRGFFKVMFEHSARGLPTVYSRFIVYRSHAAACREDEDVEAILTTLPDLQKKVETYNPADGFIVVVANIIVNCPPEHLHEQGISWGHLTEEQYYDIAATPS